MHDYSGTERAYYASLKFALEDGMIDHKEFSHLSELREQFGISQELHHQMELEIREEIGDVEVKPGVGKPLIDVGDSVVSKSTITV